MAAMFDMKRLRRRVAVVGASVLLFMSALASARAQSDYPSRPITLLVPFAAGGSSDVVMRLVSAKVADSIKQTILIENRPGGGGNVAAMALKNAPPDGYTLMLGHTGTHAINATLYPDLKFDPIKDFQPVTALISFNNLLNVPEASPAKTATELVAFAKSKPEGLTYASQGSIIIPGTPEDLAARIARDVVALGKVVKESGATPTE
jgi:tripartite-type tricarboxylate transporter receptor subunit TctC